MLYKNKNSPWSLGKYAVVALFIGCTALFVASCEREITPSAGEMANKNVDGLVKVSGILNDINGKPIAGAEIKGKGTQRGTFTDSEGKFRVDVPAGTNLEFTHAGFMDHLLEVNPRYKEVAFMVTLTMGKGKTSGITTLTSVDGKTFNSIGQASTYDGDTIFTVVEQQPEFPGGVQALYRFLGENIKTPKPRPGPTLRAGFSQVL